MKDQWYCGVDGQQYGPYTWEQLRAMAAEGRVVPETYIRREIDQQWRSAAQIPGLLARKKPALKKSVAPSGASGQSGQSDSQSMAAVGTTPTTTATSTATVTAKKPKTVKAVPVAPAPAAPPVQASGNIPVGQAVPPAAPVAPVGVAVSVAPAQVSAPLGLAINTGSPPKSAAAADDEVEPAKKKSPLALVCVLGGAALAIGVVGIALVAWNWSQPATPSGDEVANADAAAESSSEPPTEANPGGAESNPGESNPADAASTPATAPAASGKAPAAAAPASKSAGQLSGKSLAAAQKLISVQPRWGNIETYSVKINDVHVKVIGAWLAADATGKFVQPKLSDAAPADQAASTEAASAEAGKYVFVEVRLHNGGKVPRKFRSWNAAEALAAVMADEQGNVLAPVPASATPGVTRQTSLRLLPDQTVTDTLVFHAPQGTFESLKLALAQSAIAETSKKHIAFQVPVEVMFKKQSEQEQAQGDGPVSANRGPLADGGKAAEPSIAETDPPAGEPERPAEKPSEKPADEKPKPPKPPSIEELNKQFEDFDKPPPKDGAKDAPNEAAKP